jgi:Flp pilus assembly protein TadD
LSALDSAHAALKDRGPVPPSVSQKLDAGRALAMAHIGRGEGAAKLALQLIESGAREPDAALTLAYLSLATGRIEPALDFLDRAVTWAPESVVAWRMLSSALQVRGDLPNAERARQQARRLRPGTPLP